MYVNPDRITDIMPGVYPQMLADKFHGETDQQLLSRWKDIVGGIIEHYSHYVDDAVGSRYKLGSSGYKFPLWEDSPGTPAIVSEICYKLSYSSAFDYFNPASKGAENEDERTFRALAEEALAKLRSGEIVIEVPVVTTSSGNDRVERVNVMTDDSFASFGK